MSLIETSLSNVVKKQYMFKCKSYMGVFNSLAIMQLIAILFSFGGVGYGSMYVHITYYSVDTVVVFTMLWAFMTGIQPTIKATRYDDFSFVANRASSNIANALFLLTTSVIGGVTAMLSGSLLKVILHFFSNVHNGNSVSLIGAPQEFFIGIAAVILYVLLFSALGYLIGMLVQLNKVFIILLPALFFGFLIIAGLGGHQELILSTFNFFFAESSLLLFFAKVIGVSGLLFVGALVLSNRMEVKQ